ncbi:UDP-N-acetylglucosamine--N-acetylmuramyl-(pentapeptide) pyrophosphoryl-undecaprenol N-acetylglucosamine transferase [Candidatus Babeliales bacterium]|nr:UDP-N-acetylglucosamine--N-acetylmuramyl-(pentapeptide) pyrophosphoryl-undecaprenol N-acetylglucosamine transferase [Candidatus Babeliales bacterium]
MKKTICCVAGKSGGHIIPGLNYMQQILKNSPDHDILFFTTSSPLDKNLLENSKIVTHHVPLHLDNIPYKKLYKVPLFMLQLGFSFIKSFFWLLKKRPSLIISMGGYVSIPVCIAARLLRIRIELFELNVVPGKATSFLASHVSTVRICFPETKKYLKRARCIISAYPLKDALYHVPKDKNTLLKSLSFDSHKKTILVLGGSQGSHFLNTTLKQIASSPDLKNTIQIIHQTGFDDPEPFKKWYTQHEIQHQVFQFHHNLETLYPAADIVMCRAGAGTLFETLYFKTKCICIPLKATTTNHQLDNALSFSKQYPDQFITLEQKEIENNNLILENKLKEVLGLIL